MGFTRKRKGADGQTRYMAMYRDPSGNEKSAGTFDEWGDAQEAWKKEEAKIRENRWIDPTDSGQTLREYVEKAWGPRTRPRLAIRTWVGYEQKLNTHILPRFGDMPMDKIRRNGVQDWIGELLDKGQTPANVHAIFRVLRLVMNQAVKDEVLSNSPADHISLPKLAGRRMKILEPEQGEDMEDALEGLTALEDGALDERWRLMVLLELHIAARFSELRGLRPRHFNFKRNRVLIRETVGEVSKRELDKREREGTMPHGNHRIGKTAFFVTPFPKDAEERYVPVNPEVMALIKDYIERNNIGDDDLLFTTPAGGPVGVSYFHRHVWKPVCEAAGLKGVRPHDMRHTVASWMLAGGATLRQVMDHLGHSNIATTQVYTHALAEDDEAVLAALKRGRRGA